MCGKGKTEDAPFAMPRGGVKHLREEDVVASKPPIAATSKRAHTLLTEFMEEISPVRPLENLWKEAFPVGTEWDQYDKVYEINWIFSNLEKELEEGGKLYGKKVYLFGCTEPQLVDYKDTKKIIYIPAVVAVTSPKEPSDKVGIKSIQMEGETIVPMRRMKMDWVPFIPNDLRDYTAVERCDCQIFTLKCEQRRVALRNLKQEQIKRYEYCLPYFCNPMKEEEIEPNTIVDIMYPLEPPVVREFDWELDELEEFTEKLIEDEELPSEEKDKFKDFVKQLVRVEKMKLKEAKEKRKREIEEMSPETKAAFETMRFYKFYPVQSPGTPDISDVKVRFINRYYGKAHEIL